eukprot:evm.model.scf_931.4 EVM.evm.TU.scf_931.4   scf_931:29361-31639(-)
MQSVHYWGSSPTPDWQQRRPAANQSARNGYPGSGLSASLLDVRYDGIEGVGSALRPHLEKGRPGVHSRPAAALSDGLTSMNVTGGEAANGTFCALPFKSTLRDVAAGAAANAAVEAAERTASAQHTGVESFAGSRGTSVEVGGNSVKRKARGGSNGLSDDNLEKMDPKRVRRILANRKSAARSKERRAQKIIVLENELEMMKKEKALALEKISRLQDSVSELTGENGELRRQVALLSSSATECRDASGRVGHVWERKAVAPPDAQDYGSNGRRVLDESPRSSMMGSYDCINPTTPKDPNSGIREVHPHDLDVRGIWETLAVEDVAPFTDPYLSTSHGPPSCMQNPPWMPSTFQTPESGYLNGISMGGDSNWNGGIVSAHRARY